uniref:FXYD domain-containing ion transport regulator n=1 Tax=Esox lucius TaxID=8010 RepID=A0AAY5K9M9_ESOLU
CPLSSGPKYDPDADFHYDYQTLRIGGLAFAGFLVILSVILLTGKYPDFCPKLLEKPLF